MRCLRLLLKKVELVFTLDKIKKLAKDNQAKLKLFKVLPYLVGSVVEFIDTPE